MKKLLLVPLLMMSMLTGCESKDPVLPTVTLDQWLSNLEFANGHFFNFEISMRDGMMPDYNNVIADFIKEETKGIEAKKVKECQSSALLTYYVTQEHYPFDFCAIYVHEDRIETSAITPYTYNKEKVFQQFYSYKIGASLASKIVGRAYDRITEIGQIHDEERAEARSIASPYNYFDKVNASENGAKIVARGDDVTKDIVIQDTNKLFVSDFKALDYVSTTEAISEYSNKELLSYILTDELYVTFYTYSANQDIADFEITVDSSLGYKKNFSFRYLVNKDKVNTLLKKIRGEK